MARELRRVEIWTDTVTDGGTRVSVIPDWISAIETLNLEGQETLSLELRRESDAWDDVEHRRVIRTVLVETEDGSETFQEWRIRDVDDEMDRQGGLQAGLPCESIRYDLGARVIERVEDDGRAHGVFTLLGLSPTELVDFILEHAPSYFSRGTIDPTDDVDGLQFENDSPLSALQALAELTDTELEVTRNGTTDYEVHLRDQVGSTAEKAHLRYAKNLKSVNRKSDGSKLVNRAFPVGATVDGVQATMAEATWEVDSVAGSVVTLLENPISFDDQLNGRYLRKENGTLTEVTDSDASAQTVTVADATNISAGDLVKFRRNSGGDDLTFLDEPSSQSTYGIVEKVLRRQNVPLIENLLANPLLSAWTGGSPDNWSAVGAPTIAEETDDLFTRFGGSSAHVTAAEGEGIQTDAVTISPTASKPFFSGQVALRIVSGAVQVRLIDVTNSEEYPSDESDLARSNVTDRWIDRLAIEGIDLQEESSTSVRLEVTAVGGAAEFYIDAGQIENEAVSARTFFGGRASNALWNEANRLLEERSEPLVEFDVDLLDAERLQEDVFEFDELVLGGDVQIWQPDLDLDLSTRLVEIQRDKGVPGATRVKVSNRLEDLSGRLGTPGRKPLADLTKEDLTPQQLAEFISAKAWVDSDGDLHLHYRLNGPTGLSVKWLHSTSSQPTRGDTIDTGTVINQAEAENEELVTGVAPDFGDSVYVTVVAFSGASASGFPGQAWASGEIEVSMSGNQLAPGSVIADKLTENAQDFSTDLFLNPTDHDDVFWNAATLQFANGDSYAINSGSFTSFIGDFYIYWDKSTPNDLQITSSLSTATGDEKLLLAFYQSASDTNQQAMIVPAVGIFGANEDNLSVRSISTGLVQTNAITASKASFVYLRAVTADLGEQIAGTIRNSADDAGIFVDTSNDPTAPGSVPAGWTQYLNLADSGNPFLKHPNLSLNQDGSADFSGEVSADSFTGSDPTFFNSLDIVGSFLSINDPADPLPSGLITLTRGSNPTIDVQHAETGGGATARMEANTDEARFSSVSTDNYLLFRTGGDTDLHSDDGDLNLFSDVSGVKLFGGGDTSPGLEVFAAPGTNLLTPVFIRWSDGGTITRNRIEVGAADSGGTGYRVLRILN